ncbi:hypothetical protein KC327_g1549 [Hortaea werneckii]|uniref:Phospholipid/glycerol acyltransferase domain-containing protein n=2 Tax=Hortaea werneckii TaxID=91943 RepID=A0A3M7IVV2_HORWE|nr:hypothetical protein KC358_g4636 [Hortaea werneckii]OTA37950.1 hypothetical protein BTJ68_02376 [Hortaea werneckii EXF-2000]KAI6850506.1 hypothetical protein KC350_g2108 [Hortaea werneckii]KAI6943354.1 hypothetical protein KC341_g1566 [Hortaea werneckii]KAI6949267.1 hypothetical protein KC348_g1436 [Hortaea werneckii]
MAKELHAPKRLSPPPMGFPSQLALTLRSALLVVPWLAQLLIADLLLSALLPLSAVWPDWCNDTSSAIAASIWRGIQRIFTVSNDAAITVSGADQLPPGESAIVISNHVEWSDFYMIQELAERAGMLSRCRWFAKQQLKWVPFLGWGLWAMGMPLVSRRWTQDQREMDRVFDGVLQRRWPIWLVAYSEATRYTMQKRIETEEWCKANGKRLGHHLLYPRTKGFIASVQKLRTTPHVTAVYDVTLAYAQNDKIFQKPPTFGQTIFLPRLSDQWRFYVHVDRHLLADLPKSDEELSLWLEDRWVRKGEHLERLRQLLDNGQSWDVPVNEKR